jgi:myo-inositol-1(or 4)-monophosphatase
MGARAEDQARIGAALAAAIEAFRPFTPGAVDFEHKTPGDPVTQADRAVDEVLKRHLLRAGEGWLSEETADDRDRLKARRVWVVDPLDGTREFVQGIPEWCTSVGLVEGGEAVAAGIANPATGEVFIGAVGEGLLLGDRTARATCRESLEGALVLASRSEVNRGEWKRFEAQAYRLQAMGSVAYKLARVAAGLADATWTLVPKHEWDVAAGVALLRAGGGEARLLDGSRPLFNRASPKLTGLVAAGTALLPEVMRHLGLPAPSGTGPS